MKKLLLIPILLCMLVCRSQVLCIGPMCTAQHARAGDTTMIGAVLTATNKVAALTITQKSGPSTSILGAPVNSWSSGLSDTVRVMVTGLQPGIYVYALSGTDQAGGVITATDTIIVAAACPVCPVCPAPPTITGITITLWNGVVVTIPAGQGTKVAMSNGTTQSY